MYILVTLTSYSKSIFCGAICINFYSFLTNGTKFHQVVKCTRASSSQSCTKLLILDEMKNIFVFMYSQSNISLNSVNESKEYTYEKWNKTIFSIQSDSFFQLISSQTQLVVAIDVSYLNQTN